VGNENRQKNRREDSPHGNWPVFANGAQIFWVGHATVYQLSEIAGLRLGFV
jgi:hypothetical protein